MAEGRVDGRLDLSTLGRASADRLIALCVQLGGDSGPWHEKSEIVRSIEARAAEIWRDRKLQERVDFVLMIKKCTCGSVERSQENFSAVLGWTAEDFRQRLADHFGWDSDWLRFRIQDPLGLDPEAPWCNGERTLFDCGLDCTAVGVEVYMCSGWMNTTGERPA